MKKLLKQNPYLSIFIIYFFGNFTLLINNGLYWDDWVLYDHTPQQILNMFSDSGVIIIGYLHNYLLKSQYAITIYHFLVFILQLLTGYALWETLKLLKLNKNFSYWVVLIFTIIPFFSAKNTIICFPYIITNFVFYLAFFLMIKTIKNNNYIYRLLSLILFFISFYINSYVVFYLAPFLVLFFTSNNLSLNQNKLNYKSISNLFRISNFLKIIDFILLPFIFYIVNHSFSKTSGGYAKSGYNEFSLTSLSKTPFMLIETIQESFFGLFSNALTAFHTTTNQYLNIAYILIFLILMLLIRYLLNKSISNNIKLSNKNINGYFYTGFILFLLAAFPYVLVGKVPTFIGFSSRHQLILPIGTSLILVSLIYKFIIEKYFQFAMTLLVTLFIIFNLSQNIQYLKGWLKQESLYESIKNNIKIKENSTFIVLDNTNMLNATSKDLSFYNLNGIAKKSFGDQKRLLCEYNKFVKHKNNWNNLIEYGATYNMKDYVLAEPNTVIKISEGSYELTNLNALKLVFYKHFRKTEYLKNVKKIIYLTIKYDNIYTIDFYLKK